MPWFRRNGSAIGAPRSQASTQSGFWDLNDAHQLKQLNTWGDTSFPVSNPQLQWVMSAQEGPSSFPSGSANSVDLSENFPQAYSGNWYTNTALSKNSYTNSSSITRYYYPISNTSNLRTASNTSGNSDLISNGGYTFYISFIPDTNTTTWARLFNYYGLAAGSSTTSVGNTDEYKGPLLFVNEGTNRFEYRKPSSGSSNGDTSNPGGTSLTYSSNNVFNLVIQQNSDETGYCWIRNQNRTTGSVSNSFNNSSITFSGTAGYGIRSGTNTGIPVFADNYYSTNTFTGIMESGFANRPYTSTECYNLVEHLSTKYA